MPSSGMLRSVVIVRTDVSEECSASCHPDVGGDMFLRNVCSYKSHIQEDGILLKFCLEFMFRQLADNGIPDVIWVLGCHCLYLSYTALPCSLVSLFGPSLCVLLLSSRI
jgi:hypothetical protein